MFTSSEDTGEREVYLKSQKKKKKKNLQKNISTNI